MRFRLATLIWVVSLTAVLLAWYVDHSVHNRREILGTWHYPTRDIAVTGYTTSLEIRPNGTFKKTETHRFGADTYTGKYAVQPDGRILFQVRSKTKSSMLAGTPALSSCNDEFSFRCAVDDSGQLIVGAVDRLPVDAYTSGIRWERCYQSR